MSFSARGAWTVPAVPRALFVLAIAGGALALLFGVASAEEEAAAESSCANGVVVPEPEEHPDLVADCDILLAALPVLSGDSEEVELNWSADTPLQDWFGVVSSSGRITVISLAWADLTGSIPPELGQLSQLVVLNLSHNELSGPIPSELGDLSHLGLLVLWDNELSGEIPPELGNLSSLLRLDIDWNQLSGEIPPELGKLSKLNTIWLDRNELTGEIPVELTNLSQLTFLSMTRNQLSGSIPAEFGEMDQLDVLRVRGNQLTGCIPPQFEERTNDQKWAGLPFCGETSSASGGARIDGVAEPESWIMASRGTITGADGPPANDAMRWQWQRCNPFGGDCEDLDATESGYLVTEDDQGSTLRAVATFTDAEGNAQGPLASTALYVPLPRNETTTWKPSAGISAADLFDLEEGLRSILGRRDEAWVQFAQLGNGQLVPGSIDFRIALDDQLWLTD